jgi:peptidoglycan/LPS O-acetylase OafA/YrhL
MMNIPEFRRRKIKVLDGFRALAIIMVCIYHMSLNISNYFVQLIYQSGWIAVSLFFVLSGFLLSLDFIEAGENKWQFPSVWKFYKKRAFRIFPLYFCSLAFYIIYLYLNKLLPPIAEIIPHFFFLHNFEIVNSRIYGPYWSLAVEVQVYALFPFIGYLLYVNLKKERFIPLAMFLAFLVLLPLLYRIYICSFYTFYDENNDYIKLIYASPLSNLDSFGWGMIAALIFSFYNKKLVKGETMMYAALLLSGTLIFYLMHFSYEEKGWLVSEGVFAPAFYYSLLNLGWASMVLSVLMLKNSIVSNVFSSRIFYFISLISFSMYVWHIVIFDRVQTFLRSFIMPGLVYYISLLFLSLSLLIIVSFLTWRFIELPFLRKRNAEG